MMKEDIYYKLKNSKLGIKPENNDEAGQLIKILKEHNLIYKGDLDYPNVEEIDGTIIYIINNEWFYEYDDEYKTINEIITYQEFISKYLTEDINSDKKDLIKILIDIYLLENEISIQEELLLKRFGDFCKERLDAKK